MAQGAVQQATARRKATGAAVGEAAQRVAVLGAGAASDPAAAAAAKEQAAGRAQRRTISTAWRP